MSDTRDLASVLAAAERAAAAGDFSAAEAWLREAAGRQEAELGPHHPELAHTLNNLGVVCERVGKRADAEQCYRRARDIAAAALPADHPFVLTSERNLREFLEAHGLAAGSAGPQPAAASGPARPEGPAPTGGPGGLKGPAERMDAAAAPPTTRVAASEPVSRAAEPAEVPAPPPVERSAPGRLEPAGATIPVPASTGGGGQARAARRLPGPRASLGRAATVAAGAVALGLVVVVVARWGLRSHGPAGSAPAASAAGAGAPGSAGAASPAGASAAAGTAAPGSTDLAAPVEGPERSGEGAARPGEHARASGEGAGASGNRRAPAPDRAGSPGAVGSRAGAGSTPAGPPKAPSPAPGPATGRGAPSGARGRQPGPAPPALPAVSEARLCRSLSPAAGWRCEAAASPVRSGPLVFYTRVRAARATTVYHRWYAGGRVRQAVALRIGGGAAEGFRTYSRARVFPVAGGWRVELRAQDGRLLHEERFEVR